MPSRSNNPRQRSAQTKWIFVLLLGFFASLSLLLAAMALSAPQLDWKLVLAGALWDWQPFCLALLLGMGGAALFATRAEPKVKTLLAIAAGVSFLCVAKDLPDNCNIAGLAAEDDAEAETACHYLAKHLGNARLEELLSDRRLDDNIRYYLAVIAAIRGLELDSNPLLGRPGMMNGNQYLNPAEHIQFPIDYKEFAKAYRANLAKPREARAK